MASNPSDTAARLAALQQLAAQGLISADEHVSLRAAVLAEIARSPGLTLPPPPDGDGVLSEATATGSATTVRPVMPGDVLGSYRVIREVGAGAFSTVHVGEHTLLGHTRALKVVVADASAPGLAVKQLLFEWEQGCKVAASAHVVRAEPPEEHELRGLRVLVLPMELAGGDLRQWMVSAPDVAARREQAVRLWEQACAGVQAIHDAGLVHRDLKPENLLLFGDPPTVKVTDLGLARSRTSSLAVATRVLLADGVGTTGYMAPEQHLAAHPADVDHRADVWALGVVLYELCAGRLPFAGADVRAKVLDRQVTVNLAPVPEPLRDAVGWALRREARERPGSVTELLAAVRQAVGAADRRAEGAPRERSEPVGQRAEQRPSAAQDELRAVQERLQRDPFETRDEHAARIAAMSAIEAGVAVLLRERYDLDAETLPLRMAWRPWVTGLGLGGGEWVWRAPRAIAREVCAAAPEAPVLVELGVGAGSEVEIRGAHMRTAQGEHAIATREMLAAQAEREAQEQAQREAQARAQREAQERAQREAREQAERQAREQAEREAREQARQRAVIERRLREKWRPGLPGEERCNETDGAVLVWIPAGAYPQGADDGDANERPNHVATLTGFWMGKYATTNAQYRTFVEATGHPPPRHWGDPRFDGPEHPVVGVTWHDAMAYCAWAELILPWEAQWEAAARGPNGRLYPWGFSLPSAAFRDHAASLTGTLPVTAPLGGPGPYGTLGQVGGIAEWCVNLYDPQAYAKRLEPGRPLATEFGPAIRGNGFRDPTGRHLRATRRSFSTQPGFGGCNVGFRCAWYPR